MDKSIELYAETFFFCDIAIPTNWEFSVEVIIWHFDNQKKNFY